MCKELIEEKALIIVIIESQVVAVGAIEKSAQSVGIITRYK